jgi:drug/metabolite transporter (DMT)-like permease
MFSFSQLPAKYKGILWILLWCGNFTVTMTILKFLPSTIHTSIAIFMRSFFGLLILLPFLAKNKHQSFKTKQWEIHLIRVCCTFGGLFSTYYGYRGLPLGFATSIGFTGPLFTTLLSLLFLKEHITLKQWGFLLLGYGGVLIIVNPTTVVFNQALLFLFIANLLSSGAIICAKILSRTDSTLTTMLYSTLLLFLFAFLSVEFFWNSWIMPSSVDFIYLLSIGLTGSASQFCYLEALRYVSPSFVAPFEYLRLIWAIPLGYFLFQETPSYHTLIGSLVVLGAIYGIQKNTQNALQKTP